MSYNELPLRKVMIHLPLSCPVHLVCFRGFEGYSDKKLHSVKNVILDIM